MPRIFSLPLAILAIGLALVASAPAQNYPAKTVKIIIPLGPGGGGDIYARALADELQKRLGQTFIVENRTGGGLNIGARACADAPPDGYTICVTSSEPIIYNQFLFKSLPFNPEKDFEPITNLFFNTLVFAVSPALKVKTIPELMTLAKTKQLSYSTFSFPLAHFMGRLNRQYGVDIVKVPYRSGNEVVNAVLSGATPITLLGLANMVPQIQAGLITGIALNSKSRAPLAPDIPTIREVAGVDIPQSWFGLFAPAGTPKPIVAKLNAEVAKIVADPVFFKKVYIDRAIEGAVTSPEDFAKFIAEDRAIAQRIVKESGVQPE